MKHRGLGRIAELEPSRRLAVLAEGLRLISENVAALSSGLDALHEGGHARAAQALNAHLDEESAKVLILLDFVRMDQRNSVHLARQVKRFYVHLSRLIYAEVSRMNPADFLEVRRIVSAYTNSHYLDGPNEVDWVFRNSLITEREESLYVDLVAEEEGIRWVSPADHEELVLGWRNRGLTDLIGAFDRLGFFTQDGLKVIRKVWSEEVVTDATRWVELSQISWSVVNGLDAAGLAGEDATNDDASLVVNRWPFPMGQIEIEEVKVKVSSLLDERERTWREY